MRSLQLHWSLSLSEEEQICSSRSRDCARIRAGVMRVPSCAPLVPRTRGGLRVRWTPTACVSRLLSHPFFPCFLSFFLSIYLSLSLSLRHVNHVSSDCHERLAGCRVTSDRHEKRSNKRLLLIVSLSTISFSLFSAHDDGFQSIQPCLLILLRPSSPFASLSPCLLGVSQSMCVREGCASLYVMPHANLQSSLLLQSCCCCRRSQCCQSFLQPTL